MLQTIAEKRNKILPGDINLRSNFPGLTGLKFLLALIIVYYHTWPLIGAAEPNAVGAFFRNFGGLIGNQTFFTLSGFLMAYHYLDILLSGKKDFPSFLKGRLVKLYGALLRMNRSIQAEGTFGGIKWNKGYKRLHRRGIDGVILELGLISCGFNLYKYHLKKMAMQKAA